MQKLITKYGLAAHLAILAVAPLFLYSFLPGKTASIALMWMAGVGAIWLVASPSRRHGETMTDARMRVGWSVGRSPAFWAGLLLVVFAGVALANGTLTRVYEWETVQWKVSGQRLAVLPAAVEGAGLGLLSTALSLCVAVAGATCALGRSARGAFLQIGSALSALLPCAVMIARGCGRLDGQPLWLPLDYGVPSFAGVACGIWLLAVCGCEFELADGRIGLAVTPFAFAGNAVGLFLFAPPLEIAIVLVAFAVLATGALLLSWRRDGERRLVASLMPLVVPLALAVLAFCWPETAGARLKAIVGGVFPPTDYWSARTALSGIAERIWKSSPMFGGGCGSFPLRMSFAAVNADWAVVSSSQAAAINGWWQLLAEVGECGLALLVVPALTGACGWLRRFVLSRGAFAWRPVHLLAPTVLALIAVLGFLDASIARADVLLAGLTVVAVSSRSLPLVKNSVERSVSNG